MKNIKHFCKIKTRLFIIESLAKTQSIFKKKFGRTGFETHIRLVILNF